MLEPNVSIILLDVAVQVENVINLSGDVGGLDTFFFIVASGTTCEKLSVNFVYS